MSVESIEFICVPGNPILAAFIYVLLVLTRRPRDAVACAERRTCALKKYSCPPDRGHPQRASTAHVVMAHSLVTTLSTDLMITVRHLCHLLDTRPQLYIYICTLHEEICTKLIIRNGTHF